MKVKREFLKKRKSGFCFKRISYCANILHGDFFVGIYFCNSAKNPRKTTKIIIVKMFSYTVFQSEKITKKKPCLSKSGLLWPGRGGGG